MCGRGTWLFPGREEFSESRKPKYAIDRNTEEVTGGLKDMYNEELRGDELHP
jgi:hypothetical protein